MFTHDTYVLLFWFFRSPKWLWKTLLNHERFEWFTNWYFSRNFTQTSWHKVIKGKILIIKCYSLVILSVLPLFSWDSKRQWIIKSEFMAKRDFLKHIFGYTEGKFCGVCKQKFWLFYLWILFEENQNKVQTLIALLKFDKIFRSVHKHNTI